VQRCELERFRVLPKTVGLQLPEQRAQLASVSS